MLYMLWSLSLSDVIKTGIGACKHNGLFVQSTEKAQNVYTCPHVEPSNAACTEQSICHPFAFGVTKRSNAVASNE